MILHSKRLILRPFEKSSEQDMEALYRLLADETVNTFLPWFPIQSREEALTFYQERVENEPYFFAVCWKEDDLPIGYLKADTGEGHDLSYALRREYWRQGLISEAGEALLPFLKKRRIPLSHGHPRPKQSRQRRRDEAFGHDLPLFLSGAVAAQGLPGDLPSLSAEP